jgi:hypothetical protein
MLGAVTVVQVAVEILIVVVQELHKVAAALLDKAIPEVQQLQLVIRDGQLEAVVEQVGRVEMGLVGIQVMYRLLAHLEAPVYHQQLLVNQ